MEKDAEIKGEGNSYTTEFRQYDPRLGRWMSLDPLMGMFPSQSPFVAFKNNPVYYIDPVGLKSEDWVKQYKRDEKGNIICNEKGIGKKEWVWKDHIKSRQQALDEGYLDYSDGITNNRYQSTVNGKPVEVTLTPKTASDRGWDYKFINSEDAVPQSSVEELAGATGTYQGNEYEHGPITNPGAGVFFVGNTAEELAEFDKEFGCTEDWEKFESIIHSTVMLMLSLAGGEVLIPGSNNLTSNVVRQGVSETGTNTVYVSVENGVTQYVGITNNLARRTAEHLASKGINIEPLMHGLSRADARSVEQALIEIHGLSSNGGSLINLINSISKANPIYGESIKRGLELLKSISYPY